MKNQVITIKLPDDMDLNHTKYRLDEVAKKKKKKTRNSLLVSTIKKLIK